ncbi:DNA-binding response regulator [Burkholderia pseudomallei]
MPRTGGIADLSMYQSMLASLACACAPPMTSEPRACAACRFTVHAARCAIAPHARVGERTRSRIAAPCAPRISPSPIGGHANGRRSSTAAYGRHATPGEIVGDAHGVLRDRRCAREPAAFRRRLVGIQRFVQKSCEISRHDLLKIVSGFSAEIHNDINRSVSIVPIERLEIVAPSSLPTDRRSVAWFACFASRVRWSCPPIVERRACVGPRILPVRRVAARDACPSESFGFLAVQAVHDSGLPVPRGSGGGSSGCCVVAGCRDKKWCLFT